MAESDLPRDAVLRCLRDRFGCWVGSQEGEFVPVQRNHLVTVIWVIEDRIPPRILRAPLAVLGIPWQEFEARCFRDDGC